jgi:hypothetical protein
LLPLPDFDSTVEDFIRFATANGYPSALLWTSTDSILLWQGRFFVLVDPEESKSRAKANFDAAMARNIGISVEGKWKTQNITICRVYVPKDDIDAQYRLIPEKGVKLTVMDDPLPVVLVRSRVLWRLLKLISKRSIDWD